ncbi:MAG: hypothetical protein H7301_09700 [Cryobacterium sp.]|nr:hypothetical protein [Oligoflexia bacterium]
MKTILISSLLLSSTAFADSTITCSLERPSGYGEPDSASVALSAVDTHGEATSSSSGIDIGKLNYSFDLTVSHESGKYPVQIIIYENNEAMDEVGSLGCEYKLEHPGVSFCEQPVEDENGKEILKFSCVSK